ncbi:PREDICTED: regenerating islet-derived protein 4-like [Gekko japonicus]|uniref:Regenerating islet-derived protein 4-like n=1 Tax=Gekko japonicus TaxID=146911 RepID=A0ABM1K417_GEKJA|nr:PREDICTED: regenerating islet-derived protein 4-like [Gekko japonicus]
MQAGRGPYLTLLGLLASQSLMQGCDASGCPNGWRKYQRYCYGIFVSKQDWIQAEMDCQNYGNSGHLVSILSDQEAELVSKFIMNNHPNVGSIWIGLRDRMKNGRWRWADSSTSKYTGWVGGEPKKVDESGFCAYLSKKQEYQEWNDAFCTTPMAYVCEFVL